MTIAEVQEVRIDASGGYKFIVAELIDENGNKKLVVRADQKYDYHGDILEMLRREVRIDGLLAFCTGGGRIAIDSLAKTICIWDDSAAYGKEPDRQQTIRMLQKAFPDFQVSGR